MSWLTGLARKQLDAGSPIVVRSRPPLERRGSDGLNNAAAALMQPEAAEEAGSRKLSTAGRTAPHQASAMTVLRGSVKLPGGRDISLHCLAGAADQAPLVVLHRVAVSLIL